MRIGMVGLGKMGANMTRRLMRGDPEVLKAQMAAEMHAFSAALKSPEAHAAFQAFLGPGRK